MADTRDKCEHVLEGHTSSVRSVAITPDGRKAVSASGDGTLRVWSLETGLVEHVLEGHTEWVRSVAITPDGYKAVSASRDETLRVWSLETREARGDRIRAELRADVRALERTVEDAFAANWRDAPDTAAVDARDKAAADSVAEVLSQLRSWAQAIRGEASYDQRAQSRLEEYVGDVMRYANGGNYAHFAEGMRADCCVDPETGEAPTEEAIAALWRAHRV